MSNASIHEKKYSVPPSQRYRALVQLRRQLKTPLQYSHASVRTVYFDDDNLTSYFESRDGHLDKRKFRWRQYVGVEKGGAPYSLEIKIRSATVTRKVKQHIYTTLPGGFQPITFLSLINQLGAHLGFPIDEIPADLYPRITISYDRYRFDDPRDSGVRYNLDCNIRVFLRPSGDPSRSAFFRCNTDILESKSQSGNIAKLDFTDLTELGIRPVTFSKYVWGMEALALTSTPLEEFGQ